MNLKRQLLRTLSNLPGWRTRRKIVVIESDDWGSIRMPSLEAYQRLKQKRLNIDGESSRYNLNDTLANQQDFDELFTVLTSLKDSNGQHPVITAISLVANPNFNQIKQSNYQHYSFEPFTETLDRYGYGGAFTAWKEGIKKSPVGLES